MLSAVSTPYAAGATLWGTSEDLRHLHETIHVLAGEKSPFSERVTDTVLGLAYDVRHAWQGDREKRVTDDYYDKSSPVTCYGEKILWPVLLFQTNLLRRFAAFQPTSRAIQADLYRLEAAIEKALKAVDATIGEACMEWLERPLFVGNNYYVQVLMAVTREYVIDYRGKQRFAHLPGILADLSPFSELYQELARVIENEAEKRNCSPHAIEFVDDWPDFKW